LLQGDFIVLALLALILTAPNINAQTKKVAPSDAGTMHIEYGSSSWNVDSRQIDSAFMVMKDKATGKLVQIQLEETEPDSSHFDGQFNVRLGDKALEPQVYVPPKELRNPERDYMKVHQLIQSNNLEPKPMIIKKNEKGQTLIDVYDTDQQAAAAQKVWDEQLRLEIEAKKQSLVKQLPSKAAAKLAAEADQKAALAKLALQAAAQEADRIRLEQIERQKALEREKAARAMSEKERADRQAKAKDLADEAMAHYTKGEFNPAEEKFRKAIDLDPDNKKYSFRYGVTLYRLNKFNEAIVVLKLAQVEKALEVEKAYFLGLTHYRLKELDSAKTELSKAASSKDPTMGPSSTFYLGIVQFAQEDYLGAKKSFEHVIDTSQDSRMDQQAEEYIERIAQMLMFKKLQEKPWTLTGTLGMNYDSNVTYSPDQSTSASATRIDDLRLNTIADVAYRAIYNREHELSAKVNANLTNSRRDSAAPSDPWLYSFSLPYNHKGMLWGKGHVLGVKPSYEMLYMDPTDTGTKSKTLGSTLVDFDNTFVMRSDWVAIYGLQYRQDKFDLASSTDDNNFDAKKYTLKTTQVRFLDKAKKEALIGIAGFVLNNAEGKNKKYYRIDASATYTRPMKWGYAGTVGLAMYKAKYSKSDPQRTDTNFGFTVGIDKPVKEWVTWSVSGTFTKNDSSDESTYEYDKYVIMSSAVFTTNL
jgi:tetratricopeptide (TPR) repeat protein